MRPAGPDEEVAQRRQHRAHAGWLVDRPRRRDNPADIPQGDGCEGRHPGTVEILQELLSHSPVYAPSATTVTGLGQVARVGREDGGVTRRYFGLAPRRQLGPADLAGFPLLGDDKLLRPKANAEPACGGPDLH